MQRDLVGEVKRNKGDLEKEIEGAEKSLESLVDVVLPELHEPIQDMIHEYKAYLSENIDDLCSHVEELEDRIDELQTEDD